VLAVLAEVLLECLQWQIAQVADRRHTKPLEDFSRHAAHAPQPADQ